MVIEDEVTEPVGGDSQCLSGERGRCGRAWLG